MSNGRIVFPDGTSNSGKSSIAVHLCIDHYPGEFQEGRWDNKQAAQQRWPQIISGFHAAAAAIARAGNLIIVDDVLEENPPWVESLRSLFEGLEVVFVGVHCPLEELERRDKERVNRRKGRARYQFDQVHAQATYDVNVDASILSPEECASAIVEHMGTVQHSSALERLRSRFKGAGGTDERNQDQVAGMIEW
ncbi:MAG: chloramphenicol phosphotransferase [Ardenticatenales bacterium]|nr:chloramphenicol phosphotransferase [Ardenticatenales bacterium]